MILDEGDSQAGTGVPQGLAWSWEIDLEELLAAVTGQDGQESSSDPQPGESGQLTDDDEDQDAVLAAELAALEAGPPRELSPAEMVGLAAGRMPPGPGLAALLAAASPAEMADYALPDAAAAWRRIGSWAQARELDCVAQIAARAAAWDPKVGTGADGRPAQVTRDACTQVSLALTMTGAGAEWWTGLAVTLRWQLQATGAALRDGRIDLARARLIAEATCLLDEQTARAVEEQILPDAADKTTGALRAALRRAVIAADPDGAERRRAEAERRARVLLYPEAESTATLAGQGLPGVHATAAMAKIKAMARAMQAAGAPGSLDFLSAQVYIGLLLGTLPPIPPAQGAPPDQPLPDQPWGYEPPDGEPPVGRAEPVGGVEPANDGDPPWPDSPPAGADDDPDPGRAEPCPGQDGSADGSDHDDWAAASTEPVWPDLPAQIPPGLAAPGTAADGPARPGSGLLDLAVPWRTLAGLSPEPGWLGRLGPVTPVQARQLAEKASCDPFTQWRIILISPSGQARAIARIPCQCAGPGQRAGSEGARIGLVGRVTLTVPDTLLDQVLADPLDAPDPPGNLGWILAAALRAASRAAARANAGQAADAVAGGCAHQGATGAYRPPPSMREQVAARDLTCRFPTCRRPAWRGDLDHTLAWDTGGLTCRCNLGGLCRAHHMIKQHPFWTLRQDTPGVFTWTTAAGRSYTVYPDVHPA